MQGSKIDASKHITVKVVGFSWQASAGAEVTLVGRVLLIVPGAVSMTDAAQ